MKHHHDFISIIAAIASAIILTPGRSAQGASGPEIAHDSISALHDLYSQSSAARVLGHRAKAVLIFPQILKAGFFFGAEHGDGALISHGHVVGYYKTAAASYGLQAGVQKFGYALFFMTNGDLTYLHKSGGWEIGTGPSIVIVDVGMAKSMTTTTLRKGVYAFAFGQKGLMAGFGLKGSKITEINPD